MNGLLLNRINYQNLLDQVGTPDLVPFVMENIFLHDIIEYYVNKAEGASSITLSTFSISSMAVNIFVDLKEKGKIDRLECLIDASISKRKLELLYYADNVADDITLFPNHSKIIIIENDCFSCAIVSSANLTNNIRTEAGVILFGNINFYKKWIQDLFLKGIKYEFND